MNKNEKLKLIEAAFRALEFLDNLSWTNHREKLFQLCREEEKQHRSGGFAEAHTSDTISAVTAARLFAVKRVAEYLNGEKMPSGRDYLSTQTSCFYAAGLADQYREEILKAWHGFDVSALGALDYCDFVKTKGGAA